MKDEVKGQGKGLVRRVKVKKLGRRVRVKDRVRRCYDFLVFIAKR